MGQHTNDKSVPSPNDDISHEIEVYKPLETIKAHNDITLHMDKGVYDNLMQFAEIYSKSTLYKSNGLKNAYDYFLALCKGRELGLPILQTFDFIYQINGKLCTDGKGMITLLRMRPEVDDIVIDEQPDKATVTVLMTNGRSYSMTFTQAEAELAGLTGGMGWKKYPSAMRVWRAVSKLVRFYLPHLVSGMLYTVEELDVVDTFKEPEPPHVRAFNNYLIEVATDYDDTHWFIVNPKTFVGILRRDVPQWKDLSPLDVVKTALQTVDKTSWVEFASGRDAINAIKTKLGIATDPTEPPTNVIKMPQPENPPTPTFSTGENLPIEIDPLIVQPTSTPKTDEPDPNDPEDIRHAIPVYGADHWYVKHYLDFVKLLRAVVPKQDTMLNHEVSSEGLRLIGKPVWKDFPSGASAISALKAKLGIPDTPPTPKPVSTPAPTVVPPPKPVSAPVPTVAPPPKPVPAPVPTVAPPPKPASAPTYPINWYDEFEEFIWANFDMKRFAEWEAKANKKLTSYPSLDAIKADAIAIALRDEWEMLVDEATYINLGPRNTYIELNGIVSVRMYGRSSTFKKQVGDAYYAEYGVGEWENGGVYTIGLLRVSWKRNDSGTAIAHTVKVVEAISPDITPEELGITAEELEALARMEI